MAMMHKFEFGAIDGYPWGRRASSPRPKGIAGFAGHRALGRDLLHQHFPSVDIDAIIRIKMSSPGPQKIPTSSSSVLHIALPWTSMVPDGRRAIWKTIWRCPAPSKLRVSAWRVVSNSLATWSNKFSSNLEPTNICLLCGTPSISF